MEKDDLILATPSPKETFNDHFWFYGGAEEDDSEQVRYQKRPSVLIYDFAFHSLCS